MPPEHVEPPEHVIGWDIGGAHVKAAWVERGRLVDAAQWPCPLWQGMAQLQRALDAAAQRWPAPMASAHTVHAVTMTGEMVDLFPHREAGVDGIAALLAGSLAGRTVFYAGRADESGPGGDRRERVGPGDIDSSVWWGREDLPAHWEAVASANWLATAQFVSRSLAREAATPIASPALAEAVRVGTEACKGGLTAPGFADAGLLIDIGSTTTDLIALGGGWPRAQGRSDAARLVTGELVYQGVARTPLCALGPRVVFQGLPRNVMNEFFATTADVYRLTGELDADHDQHPAADGAAKDTAATRQRLARMVGLDARDAPEADWLDFARAWRARQLDELLGQLQRVLQAAALPPTAPLVAAGCGDFLAAELAAALGRPLRSFASMALGSRPADAALRPAGDSAPDPAPGPAPDPESEGRCAPGNPPDPTALHPLARRVQVAAPACAVALLLSAQGA